MLREGVILGLLVRWLIIIGLYVYFFLSISLLGFFYKYMRMSYFVKILVY